MERLRNRTYANKVKQGLVPFIERKTGLDNPYNAIEGLAILYREKHGPWYHQHSHVSYMPNQQTLNGNIPPEMTIGVIGDILDTQNRLVKIFPAVKQFFADCQFVIGNFESTISDQMPPKTGTRHRKEIVETLVNFFPPKNTLLSVANNHAGDFSDEIWSNSLQMLADRDFNLFGLKESPYFDLTPHLRVITGTEWINRETARIAMVHDTYGQFVKKDAFNLFYPHWGYELEIYPRPSIVRRMNKAISLYDAIIAHHGHTPQAITTYPINNIPRPCAYCLGDFLTGLPAPYYHYGIIVKLHLGKKENASQTWAVHSLEWRFVHTYPVNDQDVIVEFSDNFPFLDKQQGNDLIRQWKQKEPQVKGKKHTGYL